MKCEKDNDALPLKSDIPNRSSIEIVAEVHDSFSKLSSVLYFELCLLNRVVDGIGIPIQECTSGSTVIEL